jgi:hypothetical protein
VAHQGGEFLPFQLVSAAEHGALLRSMRFAGGLLSLEPLGERCAGIGALLSAAGALIGVTLGGFS